MWRRITQRIGEIRRRRISTARRLATKPLRLQRQRIVRLWTFPALVLTSMTFLYLYGQSSSIELRQLLESVSQPNVVQAIHHSATPTFVATAQATRVPIVMMTATPMPTAPAKEVDLVVMPSGRIAAIQIPAIGVDSRVVEVGWEEVVNVHGQIELVWQVAKYAVGHHGTSAAPGEQDNIVLSAHVGGYGRVFARLNELHPDDEIRLIHDGRTYVYRVREQIYVNEATATESEQIANLSYINPTGSEIVTLVTCWPPSGPDKFSQRLIVRAWPVEGAHE